MAKAILGVDIGYDGLKLVLMQGKKIKRAVSVPMIKNLVKDGEIVSPETLGDLIRDTVKQNGLRCGNAAVVLQEQTAFVRTLNMPRMTAEQLQYNLPFEFRDYIEGELKDYIFDYAMITVEDPKKPAPVPETGNTGENGEGGEENAAETMELIAAAVRSETLETIRGVIRRAGMKLTKAAPVVSAYSSLIREMDRAFVPETNEYCILDLGYSNIRMYMFNGTKHIVTRELGVGLSALDEAIAEQFNVDVHLAHTYLLTNYENCQSSDACVNAYNNITVELLRTLNFYRFSNRESMLSDAWLIGGGENIAPLKENIEQTLDIKLHPSWELVGAEGLENCGSLVQAIGVALD